jgi:GNAT superfamily N-acetyltransferase
MSSPPESAVQGERNRPPCRVDLSSGANAITPGNETALTFRAARDDDADRAFLYALFAATKAADIAAMPVGDATKDFLLRAQYRAMTETYRRDYPNARWEIVEAGKRPVGRLVTDVGAECVTYVDIALLPEAQGRGLATRLMAVALEEPKRLNRPARVKVLVTNQASLRLCERLGFRRLEEAAAFVQLEWRR